MLGIQVAVLLWRLGPGKRHFKQAAVQFSGITFVSEEFFLLKGSPEAHLVFISVCGTFIREFSVTLVCLLK